MSYNSRLIAAVVSGLALTAAPTAFAQTYVAPGGTPVLTAPGGSAGPRAALIPDAWTTGTITEAARPAASAGPRATRAPARDLR